MPQHIENNGESTNPAAASDAIAGFAMPLPVRLAPVGPPDRYGRLRAQVFLADGRWLQAEMVAAGLARVRPEGEDPACTQELLEREAAARGSGKGLWVDRDHVVKTADDPSLSERNGLYELVEGRVVSVGYGSRMVFLDFGHNYRTDFTVMVPISVVPRLAEAGMSVDTLTGRIVRVRGVIEESGGPAIRIDDPIEIELLDQRQ